MLGRGGEVMRVAGILLRRDARRRIGDQAFIREPADHLLLNVVLGGRDAVAQPPRDFFEGLVLDAIELLGRGAMRRDRGLAPARLELLDQIARRHDFGADRRDQLDGAGIDARHVRDRAVRRVLHRHALRCRSSNVGEAGMQLRAPRVDRLRAGQVIEVVALDGVHQRPGLAGLRDQVEPAPRGEVAGAAHPGEPVRHRVRPLEVVEEPGIEPIGLEGSLDGANIDGHIHTIIASGRTATALPRRPII